MKINETRNIERKKKQIEIQQQTELRQQQRNLWFRLQYLDSDQYFVSEVSLDNEQQQIKRETLQSFMMIKYLP